MNISDIFANNGALAKSIPGYQIRPGQVEMAKHVRDALRYRHHLAIEAPTGVGKSMAYIVPAILEAKQSGARVVISTATKVLQDQLYNKDLPLLQKILPFEFAILKGRGNYICPSRVREVHDEFSMSIIHRWLSSSPNGEVDQMGVARDEWQVWKSVVSDNHVCKSCDIDCFLGKARSKAMLADLVIVNHALLFSDLHYGSNIIPKYDILVIDEAHHMEDVLTSTLSYSVTHEDVLDIVSNLNKMLLGAGLGDSLSVITYNVIRRSEALFEELGRWLGLVDKKSPYCKHLSSLWKDLASSIGILVAVANNTSALVEDEDDQKALDGYADKLIEFDVVASRIFGGMINTIAWIDENPTRLNSAPLRIDKWIQSKLLPEVESLILTSATLQVNGSFRYFEQNLGLLGSTKSEIVPSPFNYKENAKLILPTDIPELYTHGSTEKFASAIAEMVIASNGRAMILCTSWTQLNEINEILSLKLSLTNIELFVQNSYSNKSDLIDQFKHSRSGVLMGVKSFWEGVDIPGPDLSLLIITKLPFDVPTDPIIAARSKLYKNPFVDFSLQRAIIAFRQGFGRLIRRVDDTGIVVVLDDRIKTKRYGQQFINALPDISIISCSIDEAAKIARNT